MWENVQSLDFSINHIHCSAPVDSPFTPVPSRLELLPGSNRRTQQVSKSGGEGGLGHQHQERLQLRDDGLALDSEGLSMR